MPYRKVGFIRVPRAQYLPQFAQAIMLKWNDDLEKKCAAAIDSLGKDRELLKNFFFERILLLGGEAFAGDADLRFKFMVVLLDFLNQTGFVKELPVQIDLIDDPVMTADTLLDLMLGSRMPTFQASDIGGDFASIGSLRVYFSEVIRRYALITRERPLMARRFRQWIGSIAFKLMHSSHQSLSQAERSFFVIYSSTQAGTKGYINGLDTTPIPPVENKDPLVIEVGALATANALPGPCTNHRKLVSNGILEQLVFYYGPHVPDLKSQIGFARKYGPFTSFDMTPEDTMPWLLESQITGLTATAGNIMVQIKDQPPFTLRVPMPFYYAEAAPGVGKVALYPDLPTYNLYLTNEVDCSDYQWDYLSGWQGRRIHSQYDAGTMDYALADLAVANKTAGGMQVEATEIPASTLCWLTAAALTKLADRSSLVENYILPGDPGPVFISINMAAFYARYGTIELLPAFSEYMELPVAWFMQPNERVFDFISTVGGLTLAQRVEFRSVIELCHNVARYERVTKRGAPVNPQQYATVLLRQGPGFTITDKRSYSNFQSKINQPKAN
jgi:hypothetical protein